MTAWLRALPIGEWWAGRGGLVTLFGFNLAHPEALLLLLPVWLWLWWWRRHEAQQRTIPFSRADVLLRGPRPTLAWTRWIPWLRALALTGVVLALAQPRSGARAERVSSEGIDIALTVDISSSMLAEDFQPQNRMEVAKEKVKRFVMGRKADRVGLVAFLAFASIAFHWSSRRVMSARSSCSVAFSAAVRTIRPCSAGLTRSRMLRSRLRTSSGSRLEMP